MKNQNLVVLGLLALILCSSCATFETNAYRAVAATASTVDAAMNGWGDWVRAGKATTADEDAVRDAYEMYQAAMRSARRQVAQYSAGVVDRSSLETALDAMDAAKTIIIETLEARYERN